ncbi:MAG TPA: hypothetical protein HA254_00845 [Candidatus Diapherotrites archaeon]|uniref:Uncharacterized protein n=1 Tax=Candidatus Iainarchaeum sp. TaxID=3101447 RepID=A0A7J4J1U0_9ARCH|nr:hypothetical protein [Candidatus Diapherotrites archaeon]
MKTHKSALKPQKPDWQSMNPQQRRDAIIARSRLLRLELAGKRAQLAAALKDAIERSRIQGRNKAEPTGTIKQSVAGARAKPALAGTNARQRQMGGFEFAGEPDYTASMHLADLFSNTGNTRLNAELQHKLGSEGILKLIVQLTQSMPNPKNMKQLTDNRQKAYELLKENADAIGSTLWYAQSATPSTVFETILARNRILSVFQSEGELETLCRQIAEVAKFPG